MTDAKGMFRTGGVVNKKFNIDEYKMLGNNTTINSAY